MKSLTMLALVLAAAGASGHSSAAGLDSWSTFGDVLAQDGGFSLTTAYLDGGEDEGFNLSGQSAVDIAAVEAGAGVAPYALDLSESEYGTEGSVAQQSFAVAAGQVLSFDWHFTTQETLFEDHAFAVIDGQVLTLATRSAPGSGWTHVEYTFAADGIASLALGVIDTVDVLGVSTLAVRDVALSPVPEPATAALWLGGIAALLAAGRRRR